MHVTDDEISYRLKLEEKPWAQGRFDIKKPIRKKVHRNEEENEIWNVPMGKGVGIEKNIVIDVCFYIFPIDGY